MLLSRRFHFDASHVVKGHPGICSGLHGHTWDLEVSFQDDPYEESGMAEAGLQLKHIVSPVIQRLHGRHLNFVMRNPTLENVCLYIAHYLQSSHGLWKVILSVASLGSVIWTDDKEQQDWRLLNPEWKMEGWKDAFEPIPVFADHKARAKWVSERYQRLHDLYEQMTEVGSELYAFELYKASLDPEEAIVLVKALKDQSECGGEK